jgi:hypothetical protein
MHPVCEPTVSQIPQLRFPLFLGWREKMPQGPTSVDGSGNLVALYYPLSLATPATDRRGHKLRPCCPALRALSNRPGARPAGAD